MEGVLLLRSRARWISDGEKVSKYFCSVEKRHFASEHMNKLILNQGEEVSALKLANFIKKYMRKKRLLEIAKLQRNCTYNSNSIRRGG